MDQTTLPAYECICIVRLVECRICCFIVSRDKYSIYTSNVLLALCRIPVLNTTMTTGILPYAYYTSIQYLDTQKLSLCHKQAECSAYLHCIEEQHRYWKFNISNEIFYKFRSCLSNYRYSFINSFVSRCDKWINAKKYRHIPNCWYWWCDDHGG